jgi:hypothetical protein
MTGSRSWRSTCTWIAVPLALGFAAFLIPISAPKRLWATITKSNPVIECPQELESGPTEVGRDAVVEFSIRNAGGGELLLHDFSATCVCLGIERRDADRFDPVKSITLSAGEVQNFCMRIAVRGAAGASLRNVISFQTNDPMQPLQRQG